MAFNHCKTRSFVHNDTVIIYSDNPLERQNPDGYGFEGVCMEIPDDLFPGLKDHVGPVLIYFDNGTAKRGFPLRKDEFVTSLKSLDEACKKAGLPPVTHD